MERTLRSGPLGHLVYFLCCAVFLVGFWILHRTGTRAFPESLVFVGVMYLFLTSGLLRLRVRIGKEALSFRPSYWMTKSVNYKDISFSRVTWIPIIGGIRRPYLLEVHEIGNSSPTLKILLMPFGQSKTRWLLRLPQLRVLEQ